MSDNLEVARECGFRIYGEKIQAPFSNEDLTDLLEAYTSRVLASQQAAHDAEIAKLNRLVAALQEDKEIAEEQIAAANTACAMKDEALLRADTELSGDFKPEGSLRTQIRGALSASAEKVQAFHDKLTEPLRREVAMLLAMMNKIAEANDSGDLDSIKLDDMLWPILDNRVQATAQAYEQEVEARGAIKALEELLTCDDMTNTGYIHKSAIARRATSKKAG